MTRITDEWVEKAIKDLETAEREIAVQKNPNYDAVCFHAQQASEKMMKAVLIHIGATPSKIHDLMIIAKTLKNSGVPLSIQDRDLIFLSHAAVTYRYPGESATISSSSGPIPSASYHQTLRPHAYRPGLTATALT